MDFEHFTQVIDTLYETKDQYNIDAWHIGGRFFSIADTTPEEVKDMFISLSKTARANRKTFDELVQLQEKYRILFGWDEIVDYLIDTLGYLGQKEKKFVDFIFEEITSDTKEERDSKYFLVFCLTNAARMSPYAIDLLWNLHWSSWAKFWIANRDKDERKELEEKLVKVDRNVDEALRDSIKTFEIASSDSIYRLVHHLINDNFHGTAPMVWGLLYEVLYDSTEVNCLEINEKGDYTTSTQDFTELVLQLLKYPQNLSYIESLFEKWCRNTAFRHKTLAFLADTETEIFFLIYHLERKLEKVQREVKAGKLIQKELAKLNEHEIDPDDHYIWKYKLKNLDENEKLSDFLESSIERLKSEETREETYRVWKKAMIENSRDRYSLAGEAYDYIEYIRHTFQHHINAYW